MFVCQTNSLHISVWKPLLCSQMWSLLVNKLVQATETCCGELQGASATSLGKAGTARAQILPCRISPVPQIYWFSAGSGPHRERTIPAEYSEQERGCSQHIPREKRKAPLSSTIPASDRVNTGSSPLPGTQGTVLCSWVNPQPWMSFWQTFGCSSSSQQLCPFKFPLCLNIFITTYWQDAACTHFSCVYIHITQTRVCSKKYL